MKLSGKVAIVTGTSPNIGGGIAGGLAAEGARVACVVGRRANRSRTRFQECARRFFCESLSACRSSRAESVGMTVTETTSEIKTATAME